MMFYISSSLFPLLWIGMNVTIYFRRKFTWTNYSSSYELILNFLENFLVVCLSFVALNNHDNNNDQRLHRSSGGGSSISELAMLGLIIIIIKMSLLRLKSIEELLKSFLVATSVHLAIAKEYTVPFLVWIATCGIATTQLLRWPSTLKVGLRKLRTLCGPSYTILILGAWWKDDTTSSIIHHDPSLLTRNDDSSNGNDDSIRVVYHGITNYNHHPTLLGLASVTSLIATIFFRPDNQSIWILLSSCWNYYLKKLWGCDGGDGAIANWISRLPNCYSIIPSTKQIHAQLMVLSYLCMVIKFGSIEYDPIFKLSGILTIVLSFVGLALGTTFFSKR